jgi:type II secretory pathway component GspD/PulD (secretin)
VTTLSGREACVQVAQIQTIVKGVNPLALTRPGLHRTKDVGAPIYLTETMHFGPVLNLVPHVSEDGRSIQLTVTATVSEFLGYDQPAREESVKVYVDGKAQQAKPPHPRIRERILERTVVLRDGETLVLGNPKSEVTTYAKDGSPTHSAGSLEKDLLVFITPTIIDSAGNRISR